MTDEFTLSFLQSVQASSGTWYQCLQTLGEGKNVSVFLVLATSGEHAGLLFALKVFRRLSDDRRNRLTGRTLDQRHDRFQNIMATIYHTLGINVDIKLPNFNGRPQHLLDEREPIRELFA